MDGAPGKRAGLPLARARRLAENAESKMGRGPSVVVATGLLSVAAIVAVGVMPGNTARNLDIDSVAAVTDQASVPAPNSSRRPVQRPEITAEVTTPKPAETADQATEIPANPTAQAPVTVSVDPPAQPVPEVEAAVEANSTSTDPYCIQMIRAKVVSLQADTHAGSGWDSHQHNVSQLVQSTLDCSHAGLQVTGSLELAGTGIADLRVRWNLDSWTLDLAVVDSNTPEADLQLAGDPDQSIEFVVQ